MMSTSGRPARPFVAVLFGCSVLAFGCGGGEESRPSLSDVQVPESMPAAKPSPVPPKKPTAAELEAEILTGELPASFPQDFAIYPEATILGSMMIPGSGGLVNLSSEGSVSEVFEFYKGQDGENGWLVREHDEGGNSVTLVKQGKVVSVRLMDAGGRTDIGLLVE